MSDRYAQLTGSRPGAMLARRFGLPRPAALERHRPGDPLVRGTVLLGGPPGGRVLAPVAEVLSGAGVELAADLPARTETALAGPGAEENTLAPPDCGEQPLKALVFDATGIRDSGELQALHAFFHANLRRLERCGRVLVLATPSTDCSAVPEATAQRSLEGFTRSLGKEVGGGATVQLLLVAAGAEDAIDSTLRFLLSPRSAYVSGQVVPIGICSPPHGLEWEKPLTGRVALVTGASRGIGEATALTLAREGAHVVGLDVPEASKQLRESMSPIAGEALPLDITTPDAPAVIAERFLDGLDILVHNAGVTRDRTLAKMPAERWSELIDINLSSQERIDSELLQAGILREGARIVCVSSMSAIAGNAGQCNYATSKAGVIGRVQALAPRLAEHAGTINAIAPGFIETTMTARMPFAIREAGRRMSSLSQGGLPIDVAETIAWLAHPASGAVNGSVIRVCGQNLLGA